MNIQLKWKKLFPQIIYPAWHFADNGDLEVDSSGQSLRLGQKDGNCDWDARVGKTGL